MNYTIVAFCSLVAERRDLIDKASLFITISPNPSTRVDCLIKDRTGKTRTVKRPYGTLKQDIQYKYCIKCLTSDYIEWLSDDAALVGVAELNERGNVHLHMIIKDKHIINEVQLQCLRRDVLNGYMTQQNIIKGKVNAKDWMNNIVFVNKSKEDIVEYFMKSQNEMLPRFQNYYL